MENKYLEKLLIEEHKFSDDQYYHTKYPKKQIVLHHTVSGMGVKGDIRWWEMTPERVATWCLIGHDGKIHRLFSSSKWAHHLYVHSKANKIDDKYKTSKVNGKLNRESIGIELDSIGPLVMKKDGKWYDAYDRVYEGEVQMYEDKYRGYEAYAKYTPQQITTLEYLLKYLGEEYNIPLKYMPQMWNTCCEALEGVPGVYTHTSYRSDKSDCHPQPELIDMLSNL